MIQMLCKQGSEVVSKRIPVPVFIVLVQNDCEIGLPSDFGDGFGS
jgi:hypothetical protein